MALMVIRSPVVDNEGSEPRRGLAFDPVFENESENPAGHLQQQQDGEKYRVCGEQRRVLPQRAHAAHEGDDKGDCAAPDEDEGGVQRDVGQLGQVVEGVLFRPGPDPDGQNTQTEQPEDDVEAEYDILEAAGDLASVADPASPLVAVSRRMRGGAVVASS